MSDFVPKKVYVCVILLHDFIQKKSAAEAHKILSETYGNHALLETTYPGACGVMVIVIGNGHGDMSSNPRRD